MNIEETSNLKLQNLILEEITRLFEYSNKRKMRLIRFSFIRNIDERTKSFIRLTFFSHSINFSIHLLENFRYRTCSFTHSFDKIFQKHQLACVLFNKSYLARLRFSVADITESGYTPTWVIWRILIWLLYDMLISWWPNRTRTVEEAGPTRKAAGQETPFFFMH